MSTTKVFALVVLILGAIVANMSFFIVDETQRALVIRLGKLHEDAETKKAVVLDSGLRFKMPFVDDVKYFDRRIQSLEISESRIPTAEKKQLIVNLFTRWRIVDFSTFYTRTGGNYRHAERLLKEKMEDGLRGEFGRRKLEDVISQDRQAVMDKIRTETNLAAGALGIEVLDARIVKIDLPDEISQRVFSMMRTERERVAAEHRAKGRSQAEAIQANADAKVTVIAATAEQQANQLRGEGDATAAKIYASVYNQDPEFYRFYRSLEAYRETFKGNNDMLVIKPDDAFFKYFRENKVASR